MNAPAEEAAIARHSPFTRAPHAFQSESGATSAAIKSCPDDFRVCEQLRHEPTGCGPHIWLQIEKIGHDTQYVARYLRHALGLRAPDVGYAGLKDRYAVTVQWFSVNWGSQKEPDWASRLPSGAKVLRVERSQRKLRIGGLKGNRFAVRLRELCGGQAQIEARFRLLSDRGFANYFGAQRFGREGGNVGQALALFRGEQRVRDRARRGLYLSAARAQLFNAALAQRVSDGTWDEALPGEPLMLDGSQSIFVPGAIDADVLDRLRAMDVHPTGPLWGRGHRVVAGPARVGENAALASFGALREGLEMAGLVQARRATRVQIKDLAWQFNTGAGGERTLEVAFFLASGTYATVLLEHVFDALHDRSKG